MNYGLGSLPLHHYCYVEERYFINRDNNLGVQPCVWFGLNSIPGRAWGCHIMLECGAIYRDVPLHALTSDPEDFDENWNPDQAQTWDCYGYGWSAHVYTYLTGLRCVAKCSEASISGDYLFTVAPIGDGFSNYPAQSKEFKFIRLDNGRYTAQPTNRVLFIDKSFTDQDENNPQWPTDLKPNTEFYTAE